MPLYDFECQDCGKIFEVRATIQEKEAGLTVVCPKCGSHEARQRLTVARTLHSSREISLPACGPNGGLRCCG